MTALVEARGVRKTFGATVALAGLDFMLQAGEIHALLGENGAGKSTFIKILAGIYDSDDGAIEVEQRPLDARGSSRIAFIHQSSSLVPSLTVAENFGLVSGFEGRFGTVNERALRRATRESLASLGMDVSPSQLVADLSVSDRALVAIARALHGNKRIVVLDEPTASLPAHDVERLFEVLRRLRDRGAGLVYVSHRLSEVLALCDRITVLRDGVRQAIASPDEVSERQLATLILGEELRDAERALVTANGPPASAPWALELKDVSVGPLSSVTFAVREGEVLGCTGLRGAGHEGLARCLFGLQPFTGEIRFGGRAYAPATPAQALRAGVGYVSGDRSRTVARGLSLTENLLLNPSFTEAPRWRRSPGGERRIAEREIVTYGVQPPEPEYPMELLSGGNAQKVVLARCQQGSPRLLLLEDPTAGVDVKARADFYSLVRAECEQGRAVILVSSDYEEVAALADRVLVFESGGIAAELTGADRTIDNLSRFAMGVSA